MTSRAVKNDIGQFLSDRAAAQLLAAVVNVTMVIRLTGMSMAAKTGESVPLMANVSPSML